MGGFAPPIPQKDSDWEIRVAVLLSLFLQMLLIFVGPVRKRSSHPVPRFLVWSCYLLADWVADLALGLMLNNMGNIGGSSSSSDVSSLHASGGMMKRGAASPSNSTSSSPIIFAFWTPFLLLHLGGPDTITAYSLEDNELWLRHLIGLLFELFSAAVIFFCSLSSNPMVPATLLMFLVGIVKYGERTYSLYSGSVNGFRDKILDDPDPGPNYAKLMTEFDAKEKAGLHVEIVIADGDARVAQAALEEDERVSMVQKSTKSLEAQAYVFFRMFRRLFVNLILSYKERKISQAYFLKNKAVTSSPAKAFEVIEVELNFIYDMLYTKAPVAHRKRGSALRFLCSACIVSSLLIFFFHGKAGFLRIDVAITYALLLGGLALDAVALIMLLCSHRMIVFLEEKLQLALLPRAVRTVRLVLPHRLRRRWSERTSQLNLISYCLGKPDPYNNGTSRFLGTHPKIIGALAKVAHAFCFREIFDDFFFIRREPLRCKTVPGQEKKEEEPILLKFIFSCLKDRATKVYEEMATDARSKEMNKICGCRGDGVLKEHGKKIKQTLMQKWKEEQLAATRKTAEEGKAEQLAQKRLDLLFGSVVDREFDESLLLWHIATDLCLHPRLEEKPSNRGSTATMEADKMVVESTESTEADKKAEEKPSNRGSTATTVADKMVVESTESTEADKKAKDGRSTATTEADEQVEDKRQISKTLSEYMLYLLIRQPEMLSATAGIGLILYRDTRAEAERFLESAATWDPDHDDARKMLLSVNTTKEPAEVKGDQSKSVLFDGVILGKTLRELDEKLMWEVVAGVWGEMLTYAAGKCRGSTHVKQLSRGGELITMVWFLMAHMGLGDMYKINEGDATAKLIVHDQ